MIKINDRVRCTDKALNAQYGIMEVWEIKSEFALCRYGDFSALAIKTFKLSELQPANGSDKHRRRFLHPSTNFVGCGLLIDIIGVDRIKILDIIEIIKPEDVYVNVYFRDSSNRGSDTLPMKYEDFKKGFLEEKKEILLYKNQANAWLCLGIMVKGKFVELNSTNEKLAEIHNLKPFDFNISYELIF